MLHVMPFMGPDLEINSILFYSILFYIYLSGLSRVAMTYLYVTRRYRYPQSFVNTGRFTDN